MAFDIDAARRDGKTDAQIADYLGNSLGFDTASARKDGKTDTEIANYLAKNSSPPPPQGASGRDAPGTAGLKRATGDLATGRPELDIQVADPVAPVKTPEPSMLDRAKQAWKQSMSAIGNSALQQVQASRVTSVVDRVPASTGQTWENPAAVKVPIDKKYRQQFEEQWDSLSEGERALMAQQDGVVGMLAKERLGMFEHQDATAPDVADDVDTRAEKRAARLVKSGIAPDVAALAARMGAVYGATPGSEMGLMGVNGTVSKSDFDFDTARAFNKDTGTQNPLKRGAALGALGLGKAVTGMGEFIADVVGAENVGETIKRGSQAIRRQEEAIGENRGDRFARSVEGAVASIGQQLPFMLAGAASGGTTIPLAAIAVTSFGNEYSDGRKQGQSVDEAVTRAAMYSAFEVIGERFGLGEQLDALRGAIKGMEKSQVAELLWDAMVKQVPGEVLTTTGQFSTDKFMSGGIGLTPDATFEDYFEQVADTIATTMVQSVMMGGGTMALSAVTSRGQSETAAEADAAAARDRALNKWQSGGLVRPAQPAPADAVPEIQPGVPTNAEPAPPPAPAAPEAIAPAVEGEAAQPTGADAGNTPITLDRRALADAFTIDDEGTIDASQATTAVRAQVESALAAGTPVVQRRGKSRTAVSSVDEIDVPAILAGKSRIQIGGQPVPAKQKGGETNGQEQIQQTGQGGQEALLNQKEESSGQPITDDSSLTLADKAKAKSPVMIRPDKDGYTVLVDGKPQVTFTDLDRAVEARDALIADISAGATPASQQPAPADTKKPATDPGRQQLESMGVTPTAFDDETATEGQKSAIDAAAHAAATSPTNALPEPTPAQAEAGNYQKGHLRLHGLDISIENPKGSTRRSKPGAAKPWERTMVGHYGYVKGSTAADGDHVDVFIGEKPDSDKAYVIDQVIDGKYDEAKVVLGADSEQVARELYLANYEDGWQGLGAITEMPIEQFKEWIKTPATKKPVKWRKSIFKEPQPSTAEAKPEAKKSIIKAENEKPTRNISEPDSRLTKVAQEVAPAETAAAIDRAKSKTPDQFASWVRGRYGRQKAAELIASGQVDKWYAEANPQKSETIPVVEPEKPKVAAVPTEAPKPAEPSKPAVKIEDFGQKLEGARKDYAAKLKDAQTADIAKVPLSESWPEPDYAKLLDSGADPWAVGFMHAARDEIPTKPQRSWKLKSWVGQVALLRDTAEKIASGELPLDRAKQLVDDMPALHPIRDRIELYQAVGHDKSLKGIRIAKGQYSVFHGKELNPAKVIWSVESNGKVRAMSNWPNILGYGDTRDEAIAGFKKKWSETTPEQDTKKSIKFELYSRRSNNTYFIGKKIGKTVVELKDGFSDIKAARAYLLEHHDELVALLEKKKEIPSERREENAPRVGIDHRNGADVTPEQFQDAFGFRGVQFGTFVEGTRRQADLNESYDALMDLAGVLGIPPKALSLNGELGLAFGARGHGGKLAPKAHYELGQVVINLTKRAGSGSLAHEWLHGVDNYFSRKGGNKNGFLSLMHNAPEGVRTELFEAFKNVVRAIKSTELPKRSLKLDQTRSKPYWLTTEEMMARSFESYIIAKLQDQGASNDYLANIVSPAYWDAATGLGIEKQGTYPYPLENEMPEIRAAFDQFFATVETKEEDGKVALYQRGARTGRGLPEKQVTAEINRVLRGFKTRPPLIVRQSYEQLPAGVRAAVEARGDKPGDMRAIYWDGKLYAIADDIPSMEDIPEIVMHEVVGHFGLDAMLDQADKQAILDGFGRDLSAAVDSQGAVEFGEKWNPQDAGQRRKAAEEVFAYHTQKYLKGEAIPEASKSWVQKLIARINKWVKSVLGLDAIKKLPDRYDEKFMRRLADSILKSLRKGQPISGTGKTRSAEARDGVSGTPMFTKKAPIFYSKLLRSAQLAKITVGTGEQWIATLRNMPGVKAEEIEATDLEQFLGDRKGVTKQEVVDYLQSNSVQVTESMHGGKSSSLAQQEHDRLVVELTAKGYHPQPMNSTGDTIIDGPNGVSYKFDPDEVTWEGSQNAPSLPRGVEELADKLAELRREMVDASYRMGSNKFDDDETRYKRYTLPGGENYRELLLTLPTKAQRLAAQNGRPWEEMGSMERYEYVEAAGEDARPFTSSHWNEPNVIAHIRFDERTDADGKRVMHIAEVQSDFGQATRKSKLKVIRAVKADFTGIVERMKADGVLTVECD